MQLLNCCIFTTIYFCFILVVTFIKGGEESGYKFYIIIWFILGSCIGSFMLCLTYETDCMCRKSRCDQCHHNLAWMDLIPVYSFLLNRGRCRYCNCKLSSKYLICEILTGLALVYLSLNQQFNIDLLATIAIMLIPLSIYDTEHLKIPNIMLILLFITLMLINLKDMLIYQIYFSYEVFLFKLLIFILLHLFFFLSKCIGYGDIKLFSILLLFLPIPFFIALFFITYLIGGLSCIIFLSYKTGLKKVPLIPFITTSFFVVLLLYEQIKILYFGGFV
ncbi:A24 family peptidase [Macrococcoides goetzii]|uniref:prepilin peptidase n=1 Tax=Macrococcus TaxID=69965 RepID=UPI001FDB4A32|nr:prepilin peptidase [Macrococcus sp. PK]